MSALTREWLFWISAAACVIAEVAFIISCIRSLIRTHGGKALSEAIWAVIPALALAWLLAATWAQVQRGSAHEHMNMPMPTSGA